MTARFWINLGIAFAVTALLIGIAVFWQWRRERREAQRRREHPKDTIEIPIERRKKHDTDHFNLP